MTLVFIYSFIYSMQYNALDIQGNSQYAREWKSKAYNRKEGHVFIASQCFMKVWHIPSWQTQIMT